MSHPHIRVLASPNTTQIAKFMGPTWGPPGSCRPQMGPMLAPWTLLSGQLINCLICKLFWLTTNGNQNFASLALCEENLPVAGGFPSQRAIMWKAFPEWNCFIHKLLNINQVNSGHCTNLHNQRILWKEVLSLNILCCHSNRNLITFIPCLVHKV